MAPGALGLFMGTQIAKMEIHSWDMVVFALSSFIVVGLIFLLKRMVYSRTMDVTIYFLDEKRAYILTIGCFLVVILRSYVGMAVTFSWKSGFLLGFVCVLAVVLGKMAGGILSAKIGIQNTMLISLWIAAIGYRFSENMILGIIALFAFNMSMPITLYLLVRKFKELPGFAFGLLTFALFLGYLPIYLGIPTPIEGNMLGAGGSVMSLLILLLAIKCGGTVDVE